MTTTTSKQSKKSFPTFNVLDYDASLSRNLSFYNLEVENEYKKSVALDYWKILGKDVKPLSRLNDVWFSTCGAVAHMHKDRGIELEMRHLLYMENKYKELLNIHEEREEEKEAARPVIKVTREDKDAMDLAKHIAEFEHGVDLIYAGKEFDAKSYLLTNDVKPSIAKQIGQHFKPVLKELKDIDSDDQLQEAYDAYSKRDLRVMRESITTLISSCDVVSAINKARIQRTKKEKSPLVTAKDVNYLREYPELSIKSVMPDKIVNSSEVWIFNVKVRRLFKYEALGGNRLTIKGTTILNFDPSKSGGKIIRKPEVSFKDIADMTSRPLTKLYTGIRAVASKATGRINEDCIILKCF
jgi:hypothetical protein